MGTSQEDDEQFIYLLLANDSRAMQMLYDNHYKAILRSVRKFIYDQEAAKDIVQNLFIAIWEKRHQLTITSPVRKYLFSAAHNRCLNYQRNLSAQVKGLSTMLRQHKKPVGIEADLNIREEELRKKIREALALLPPNAKKVFLMSRFISMSNKEMAAHFHVTEKAIEKSMTKAMKLLRMFLAEYLKIVILASAMEI